YRANAQFQFVDLSGVCYRTANKERCRSDLLGLRQVPQSQSLRWFVQICSPSLEHSVNEYPFPALLGHHQSTPRALSLADECRTPGSQEAKIDRKFVQGTEVLFPRALCPLVLRLPPVRKPAFRDGESGGR